MYYVTNYFFVSFVNYLFIFQPPVNLIPVNAIPDANVIPANDELAIANPGSLRVTLSKGSVLFSTSGISRGA